MEIEGRGGECVVGRWLDGGEGYIQLLWLYCDYIK